MQLTFPRLVTALTFVAIFAMAARPSVDTDTWWHLRSGAWTIENRAVPQTDPFSHTRLGADWHYPAWLSQVVMYGLFTWFGFAGLNLFTALFVTLAFWFVYQTCEGHPLLRAFTLILAAAASAIFWSARPQIVSFALAAVFVYVLHQFRWRGLNRLWVLVPLMALWANIHAGFAIGFILIGLTLAGQLSSAAWQWLRRGTARPLRADTGGRDSPPLAAEGDRGWRGAAWLAGIGLACAAAVPLNPYGPAMLVYPLKTVSIGVLRDFIQEWQSPNFHEVRAQTFLWLLFATVMAVGLARRRANFTDLLVVSGTAYLGFLAWRNVSLLSLVAPAVLTRQARDLWPVAPAAGANAGRPPARAVALNWTLLGLLSLAALLKVGLDMQPALNQAALARLVPVAAADYVRRAHPPGQMFNAYNFGGYLTWALYPDYPVFVDGRTDLYDDAFLREYLTIAFARPGWQATLDRYSVRLAVVEADSILADVLAREPGWHVAYRDETAAVFQKTGSP